jgi:lysyl-tRNA synthetase class 2
MNWQPTAGIDALQFRAGVLAACRSFFQQQGVLEVTTPALSRYATTEPNIQSFTVRSDTERAQTYYLQTSPELPMKRLLAAGSGPIYQIGQVFRATDSGRYHRPEFTLLEWYRPAWSYRRLMEEVEQLVRSLPAMASPPRTVVRTCYRELFLDALSLDPMNATVEQCRNCCAERALPVPDSMGERLDPWLDLLLSTFIAPRFPDDQLTFLYDFPASQAALARLRNEGDAVLAERFELYWGKVELANGFQELTDPDEQLQRFLNENEYRGQQGQPQMPIDRKFLAALQSGMPESSGVALGIDRLLMSLMGVSEIRQVMAFAAEH